MMVRFNKGPWHRRLLDLSDKTIQRGVVQFFVHDSEVSKVRMYDPNPNMRVAVGPGYKIATYRIKMVTVNLRGTPETLPSVFPDGAVCFELEGFR